jgi:hypothetical protein
LFEPIIITIPKRDAVKTSSASPPKTTEGRARVIDGQPIQPVDLPPCTLAVSQEKVSLINNGGSISVLVGAGGGADLTSVRAASSSTNDISVAPDTDVEGIEGRRLFVIKSISENTGVFQVTFQLPCGKKEISVTVR